MKGLDALVARILEEARERADGIAKEASAAVAATEAEADAAIAEERRASERGLAADLAALERSAASASSLESRRILLAARRELVAEVLAQALERLAALPADRRTALYADLLERHGRGGGTVAFAAADVASGVAAKALREASRRPALAGAALEPADAPHAGRGGLVLRQGDVTTDLTFERLLLQSQEDLESFAAGKLGF